jgi:hypothetical protein
MNKTEMRREIKQEALYEGERTRKLEKTACM